MSEDDGVSSAGGFSDQGNASLVGFGEDASGRSAYPGQPGIAGSRLPGSPVQGVEKAKMLDGQTYDRDVVDTTTRSPMPVAGGREYDGMVEDGDGYREDGKGKGAF